MMLTVKRTELLLVHGLGKGPITLGLVYTVLEKKALQGARLRVIKRSAETFRLALGGRRTLGAGRSVIPEICCQRRAAEAPPSSCGRTIGDHVSRAPH
jgi:hypothetical protein